MNDDTLTPTPIRLPASIAAFARQDAQAAERREALAEEQRQQERDRQASYTATVRQTVEAFRSR